MPRLRSSSRRPTSRSAFCPPTHLRRPTSPRPPGTSGRLERGRSASRSGSAQAASCSSPTRTFGRRPRLRRIVFELIPTTQSSLLALRARDVDIAEVGSGQIPRLARMPAYARLITPINGAYLLFVQTTRCADGRHARSPRDRGGDRFVAHRARTLRRSERRPIRFCRRSLHGTTPRRKRRGPIRRRWCAS